MMVATITLLLVGLSAGLFVEMSTDLLSASLNALPTLARNFW